MLNSVACPAGYTYNANPATAFSSNAKLCFSVVDYATRNFQTRYPSDTDNANINTMLLNLK